jgi:hypothetical protein
MCRADNAEIYQTAGFLYYGKAKCIDIWSCSQWYLVLIYILSYWKDTLKIIAPRQRFCKILVLILRIVKTLSTFVCADLAHILGDTVPLRGKKRKIFGLYLFL